jgi:HAMP domain-containing protein
MNNCQDLELIVRNSAARRDKLCKLRARLSDALKEIKALKKEVKRLNDRNKKTQ